jgi:hypothetical protein
VPHPAPDIALPGSLLGYFWEYDVTRLRARADSATVMLRLMESGDQDAITWLRRFYGDAALVEFLSRRRGRGVSLKRLRYWALLLALPEPEVTSWIAALRTNPWYTRARE